MAITLKKGEGVSLRKNDGYDLSTVTIGLGWDVAQPKKKGLLGGLFSKKPPDYDLDAIAFLLDENGKVVDLGDRNSLVGGDVVFFNAMRHHSGAIWLTGDNRTGEGDGDDEQIIVRLDEIPPRYARILFVVSIYNGRELGQSFGEIENAFIRAVDAKGKEIARFNVSGTEAYQTHRSLTFAELTRQGAGWHFKAHGVSHETDRFVDILRNYI